MPDVSFCSLLEQIKTGKKMFPVTVLYGFSEFLGQKIIREFSDTLIRSWQRKVSLITGDTILTPNMPTPHGKK